MESKATATNLSVYLALFIFAAAAIVPGVHSVVFAIGQDAYAGDWRYPKGVPFINQFNEWGVGNPRRVAYTKDFTINEENLGLVCGANWLESKQGGNEPPGLYDLGCVPTPREINEHINDQGFYVGELKLNNVNIGSCTIYDTRQPQLCDKDIESNLKVCLPYIQCA